MPETVDITELLEIDPSRVDAVTSPANGTEWLILKALDDSETVTDTAGVIAEIAKAGEMNITTEADVQEATVDDVLAEINKTMDPDDDRPPCKLCKGKK